VCATVLRIVESNGSVEAWTRLEQHFCLHKALVNRFGRVDGRAVVHMWKEGRNEYGETLSSFERAALVERYCQLFGHWPSGYSP
jgi:hypothetical protein